MRELSSLKQVDGVPETLFCVNNWDCRYYSVLLLLVHVVFNFCSVSESMENSVVKEQLPA